MARITHCRRVNVSYDESLSRSDSHHDDAAPGVVVVGGGTSSSHSSPWRHAVTPSQAQNEARRYHLDSESSESAAAGELDSRRALQ